MIEIPVENWTLVIAAFGDLSSPFYLYALTQADSNIELRFTALVL